MPSTIIGPVSGAAQLLISGSPWSGQTGLQGTGNPVQGGLQLALDVAASGNVYIGLSGNVTMNSGSVFLSGGGLNDGMQLTPGGSYFIPKIAFPISGFVNVYCWCDPAVSGVGRLFYQIF